MENTVDVLAKFILDTPKANPSISSWSVGMQIHHSLLATMRISQSLIDSKPADKRQSFNFLRSIILLTGKIPRGRGKAPKPSIPNRGITENELTQLVPNAKTLLESALHTAPKSWWEHFAFGIMYRDTAIKFIHVHNRHHISIISDIIST